MEVLELSKCRSPRRRVPDTENSQAEAAHGARGPGSLHGGLTWCDAVRPITKIKRTNNVGRHGRYICQRGEAQGARRGPAPARCRRTLAHQGRQSKRNVCSGNPEHWLVIGSAADAVMLGWWCSCKILVMSAPYTDIQRS